ncbi:MAG TPA: recombination-associated protein RdgC, partial [Burkholderiaceae bacterium]
VVLEGQEAAGKGDNNFDADVAIATGELGKLIPDLVEALGGPLKLGQAGTSTTDKVIAALTGQTAAMDTASPYAPANAEDAAAPF